MSQRGFAVLTIIIFAVSFALLMAIASFIKAGAQVPQKAQIAYTTDIQEGREIYIMDADGVNRRKLTNNDMDDVCPSWSPDGKKIAFTRMTNSAESEIYVMDADGTNQIDLTNNPAIDRSPSWSPNGKQIIFQTNRDGNGEIYIMNADGSNPRNLTNSANWDRDPSVSSDGQKIAYISNEGDGDLIHEQIYTMDINGNNKRRLSTKLLGFSHRPTWSPDSRNIAFDASQNGSVSDIYVMTAEGNNLSKLTNDPAFDDYPAWSPDGQRFAFHSNRKGPYNIHIMDANGGNIIRIETHTWERYPDWFDPNHIRAGFSDDILMKTWGWIKQNY